MGSLLPPCGSSEIAGQASLLPSALYCHLAGRQMGYRGFHLLKNLFWPADLRRARIARCLVAGNRYHKGAGIPSPWHFEGKKSFKVSLKNKIILPLLTPLY